MSWEPELDELRRREALARETGGEERVARQHASGRRTVRERIERLFDPTALGESPDKEALGGSRMQTRAGAVDNEAADEDDALAQLRRFLSYLPPSVWDLPPVVAGSDPPGRREEALLSIVPRDPRKPYDMRAVLNAVRDAGSVFELGARHGRSLICSLARLDGHPVGVLASDPKPSRRRWRGRRPRQRRRAHPRRLGQARALRRPLRPVPPAGRQPRRPAGLRDRLGGRARGHHARGARALFAVHQATVPWVSVLVRKVYGVAGAAHGDASRLNLRHA